MVLFHTLLQGDGGEMELRSFRSLAKELHGERLFMKAFRVITLIGALVLMPALAFGAKININKAGVQTLQELDGVGPSKAQAIVNYRERNGRFQALTDLTKVRGIGEQTLDANRDRIAVQ